MSFKRKQILKYTGWGVSGVLVIGLIFLTGFLSFSGMLYLNGSIFLAIAAFLLSGGIEGEVYAQNIFKSFLKLFSRHYLRDLIYTRELDKLLDEQIAKSLQEKDQSYYKGSFFYLYNHQKAYVNKLKKEHHHGDKKQLRRAEKRLKWMRKTFILYMNQEENNLPGKQGLRVQGINLNQQYFKDLDNALNGKSKSQINNNIENEIRKKRILTWLSWFFTLIAGACAGFVALDAVKTSLSVIAVYFGFGIPSVAMNICVYSLAVLAAFGYVFLIYNTITDIIHNDTIKKWVYKIKDFLTQGEKEHFARYLTRCLSVSLLTAIVLGLGIFATVATAGTWWFAAKKGVQLVPHLSKAASWIRNLTVPIMGITNLIFTITNSLQSLEVVIKNLNFMAAIKNKMEQMRRNYLSKENLMQKINPFRILILTVSFPFNAVIFIGHLISMALMGDNLKGVPPAATATINAISEALTDGHYFASDKDQAQPKDDNKVAETEEPDHVHADITGRFLKFILSPVYVMSGLWDWVFSQMNPNLPIGYDLPQVKLRLQLVEALKLSFKGKNSQMRITHEITDYDMNNWQRFEKAIRVIETVKRAESPIKRQSLIQLFNDNHDNAIIQNEDKACKLTKKIAKIISECNPDSMQAPGY